MPDCCNCKTFDHCRECYSGREFNFKNGILVVLLVAAICLLLAALIGDPSDALRRERERRAAAESHERAEVHQFAREIGGH